MVYRIVGGEMRRGLCFKFYIPIFLTKFSRTFIFYVKHDKPQIIKNIEFRPAQKTYKPFKVLLT